MSVAGRAIPRASLTWILVAQAFVMLPHLTHLPPWVIALWVACAGWRVQVYRMRADYPPTWVKAGLMVGTLGGVYLSRGGLLGLDAAVVILIAAFVLKLIEMRTRRDALVVIFLGFFAVVTRYFFDSEIVTAVFSLLPIIALVAALIGLQQSSLVSRPGATVRLAISLLAQALPLMLVLFLFFPRMGPLWALPQPSDKGVTGLSDSMAPGQIAELGQSSELAFRASFDGAIPPRQMLYWRALTLDRFDGQRWTASPQSSTEPAPGWSRHGEPVTYSVVMERSARPWLFTLDVSESLHGEARMKGDFRLERSRPVNQTFFYAMRAWPDAAMETEETRNVQRALQLPVAGNPRARAWGEQLEARYPAPADRVAALLAHFRDEPFVYTLRPDVLSGDTVDAFLFESRRGFCEHYAGAMTFVLRAAGVPSRVVTGYQGGEINTAGNYLQVRQYDAHAWVEYWESGRGWQRVDPTFQVAPARIEANLEQAVAQENSFLADDPFSPMRFTRWGMLNQMRMNWDRLNYGWQRWVLNYQAESQANLLRQWFGALGTAKAGAAAIAAAGLMLALLAIGILRPWRRPRRDAQQRQMLRFEAMLFRHGLKRATGEGARAFGERAAQALPGQAEPIRAFVRRYEAQRYGSQSPREGLAAELANLKRSLRR